MAVMYNYIINHLSSKIQLSHSIIIFKPCLINVHNR